MLDFSSKNRIATYTNKSHSSIQEYHFFSFTLEFIIIESKMRNIQRSKEKDTQEYKQTNTHTRDF